MEQTGKQFRKRTAILTCLRQSKAHPSAEDIYHSLQQEHSDISLASVYRNIKLFKDEGLIISLGTVNGVERLDAVTEPHAHFICEQCDAVIDVDAPCDDLRQELEQQYGCTVQRSEMLFRGVCARCKNKDI